MRIAVIHNLRRPGADEPPFAAEFDDPATIDAICAALGARGDRPEALEADEGLPERLERARPDLAFNLAEGRRGRDRESQVPALLELLGIPYTGSGPLVTASCLDKPTCKRLLRAAGLPTPAFAVVPPGATPTVPTLHRRGLEPPLFVKPASQGSSVGIDAGSLCFDWRQAARRVARIHAVHGEPALVETYLPGREFTVGLLGDPPHARCLPITEIAFGALAPEPPIFSYTRKIECFDEACFPCPAAIPESLAATLARLARRAVAVLGCLDVARVDLRLDANSRPQVLEINPLPGLAPGRSELPRQAAAAGISYDSLICAIVESALARRPAAPLPGCGSGGRKVARSRLPNAMSQHPPRGRKD